MSTSVQLGLRLVEPPGLRLRPCQSTKQVAAKPSPAQPTSTAATTPRGTRESILAIAASDGTTRAELSILKKSALGVRR